LTGYLQTVKSFERILFLPFMTVYVRTEEGQLAAYSIDSAVPRKLRSLLKVIDGKTSVDVYINSLRAFGDVQGVFKSFDMAGLIRPMSQPPAGSFTAPETEPATPDAPASIWSSAKTMIGNKLSSQNFKSSSAAGQSNQTASVPGQNIVAEQGQLTGTIDTQALARAVDLMSNFVLTHTPEHAMMVLKELEQLASLDQLAVTLGGYQQVISHLGAPAQEHLLLIKQILRENM
jgi:hypothetical protein